MPDFTSVGVDWLVSSWRPAWTVSVLASAWNSPFTLMIPFGPGIGSGTFPVPNGRSKSLGFTPSSVSRLIGSVVSLTPPTAWSVSGSSVAARWTDVSGYFSSKTGSPRKTSEAVRLLTAAEADPGLFVSLAVTVRSTSASARLFTPLTR